MENRTKERACQMSWMSTVTKHKICHRGLYIMESFKSALRWCGDLHETKVDYCEREKSVNGDEGWHRWWADNIYSFDAQDEYAPWVMGRWCLPHGVWWSMRRQAGRLLSVTDCQAILGKGCQQSQHSTVLWGECSWKYIHKYKTRSRIHSTRKWPLNIN